jgi:hypothetical protein
MSSTFFSENHAIYENVGKNGGNTQATDDTIWYGTRKVRLACWMTMYMFIFNYTLQPFKTYCTICVRHFNFRHQASPRMSLCENTQRRKVELWARNVREFGLNVDFHVTFRDLLHAVKLRHGTDGFTSPPNEGVLRIFSALKIQQFQPGANPAEDTSTLPLDHRSHYAEWLRK